jgi:putative transposase
MSRYFFTVVTQGRQPLLVEQIGRLRQAFRHVMERYPFDIEAIVILPDHLHTIWRLPPDDVDYSHRWMLIKRSFSSGLPAAGVSTSMQAKREKGIWQRRFWEHGIRHEEDWRRHMDYIHFNPAKHGYVARPDDWPHSSFRKLVARSLYDPGWTLADPVVLEGAEPE